MGTDIHWIIERREIDGNWHCCASKCVVNAQHMLTNPKISYREWDALPEAQIGRRNYALFDFLFEFATPGWPSDLSEATKQHRSRLAWDAPGTLAGEDFFDDESYLQAPDLGQRFARIVRTALGRGLADTPFMTMMKYERTIAPAYLLGKETGHEAAARIRVMRQLVPFTEPQSWRMLTSYG